MIKQLQLRGISRTPSDRASADGGCAESLNVHLDQGETAPTMPPIDISEDIYGNNTPRYPIKFIHKMRGIKHYIGVLYDSTNHNYKFAAYGEDLDGGVDYMGNAVTVDYDEPISFSSIGNTFIAFSATRPYYFLFKGGSYTCLGSAIPKPKIEVASLKADARYATGEIADDDLKTSDDITLWNQAAVSGDEHNAGLLTTMNNLWDSVKLEIGNARNDGVFVAPFFIRYAVRLYDGRYIYTSTPILCGGGVADNWLRVYLSGSTEYTLSANFMNNFRVYLKGAYLYGNWADIVKSIDFFASTPIYAPAIDAQYFKMSSGHEILFDKMGPNERDATIREEVFSKGQFYKIKSIQLTDSVEMGKLSDGTVKIDNSESVSGDLLLEQEELEDGYRDGAQYIPTADVKNFNNRLFVIGADELLSRGDTGLNGLEATGSWETASGRTGFTLRYKIVDSATGQAKYVLAHYRNDDIYLYQPYFQNETTYVSLHYGNETPTGQIKKCEPYAWICYPDTRCTQVEIFYTSDSSNGKVIPMEPHPYLECSCAFLGFGVQVRYPGANYASVSVPSSFSEDRVMNQQNKIFLSEADNPFLFPAGNIVSFPDKLVGAAGITVPLSEGQAGAFNIYVFTEGGIRVLIPTADGTFAANMAHPGVSRHIALKGTIMPMEQAVVFITEKGVMLLTGSSVQEISREMNGKPYSLEYDVWRYIYDSSDVFNSILGPTRDTDTFMGFMREAKVAYDFQGARLLFFKSGKSFQYEYRLETQSWHKYYVPMSVVTIINSYPECLVSYSPNATPTVLNLSTVLHDADLLADTTTVSDEVVRVTYPGIVITRPFDLGEPDIRKAIRSIRVRGNYKRDDVQYILLGSFDGINWQRMTSLRGGSYKQFRLILLTDLTATERVTWIDIDYESRFTNRLR